MVDRSGLIGFETELVNLTSGHGIMSHLFKEYGPHAGEIQNRTTGDTYNVTVRMDDGRRVTISQRDLGGVRENTYVRVQNGRVVIR